MLLTAATMAHMKDAPAKKNAQPYRYVKETPAVDDEGAFLR